MMRRFDRVTTPVNTVQQTRRAASATGRKIGSSTPEGLGGLRETTRPHCGAVAGKSTRMPMT